MTQRLLVASLALLVVAGCTDDTADDQTGSVPATTTSPVDRDGSEPSASVSDADLPQTPPGTDAAPDRFVEVDQTTPRDRFGIGPTRGATLGISSPLVDGVYHASSVAVSDDRIVFELDQFLTADACIAQRSSEPEFDEMDCFGGVVLSEPTAEITLDLDADVPVFIGSGARPRVFRTNAADYALLIGGDPAVLADAIAVDFLPWTVFVLVEDERVAGVAPRFTS